jgi:hypothetical protein
MSRGARAGAAPADSATAVDAAAVPARAMPACSRSAFAAALLDPSAPVPHGLEAWNGSDPTVRFAVYRNNVVRSLAAVLGDTFPVVREWVGDACFDALARRFIVDHPPTSPLMHRYGDAFAAWLSGFEPAPGLACLPDLAWLELARLHAFHAADTPVIPPRRLAAALHEPERLVGTVLRLAPSLTPIGSVHPVVSLWHAHQCSAAERDALLGRIDPAHGESALVFRTGDDAVVLGAAAADVALAAALAGGAALGVAAALHPTADLARLLGVLLGHGLVVGALEPARRRASRPPVHPDPCPATP